MQQVALSGKQFKELVSGHKITLSLPIEEQKIETLELSLDIGFASMKHYIQEAELQRDFLNEGNLERISR